MSLNYFWTPLGHSGEYSTLWTNFWTQHKTKHCKWGVFQFLFAVAVKWLRIKHGILGGSLFLCQLWSPVRPDSSHSVRFQAVFCAQLQIMSLKINVQLCQQSFHYYFHVTSFKYVTFPGAALPVSTAEASPCRSRSWNLPTAAERTESRNNSNMRLTICPNWGTWLLIQDKASLPGFFFCSEGE